jgi:hypothetical protein
MINAAANESWRGAVGAFRLLISGHADARLARAERMMTR